MSASPLKLILSTLQDLLKQAHEIKQEANQLYASGCYDQAISSYDRALASCPNYLDYDVAVLRCNISACYLKLEDWKAAVDSATTSLDRLEKIIPSESPKNSDQTQSEDSKSSKDNDAVVEISGDDEDAEEKELQRLKELDETRTNVLRIRAKALMRRAKGKSQAGGWASLQGALEDYQVLDKMNNLPPDDRRIVQRALRDLPGRINEAKDKEMGEMMSKMKDVSAYIHHRMVLGSSNSGLTFYIYLAWKRLSQTIRVVDGQL